MLKRLYFALTTQYCKGDQPAQARWANAPHMLQSRASECMGRAEISRGFFLFFFLFSALFHGKISWKIQRRKNCTQRGLSFNVLALYFHFPLKNGFPALRIAKIAWNEKRIVPFFQTSRYELEPRTVKGSSSFSILLLIFNFFHDSEDYQMALVVKYAKPVQKNGYKNENPELIVRSRG